MIVAGVMSGTSADGINVALVRIQGRGFRSRLELLAHYEFPYPSEVRHAVLQAMNAAVGQSRRSRSPQLHARQVFMPTQCARPSGEPSWNVNWWAATARRSITRATPSLYLGRPVACTWQTGESAIIAASWAFRSSLISVLQTWQRAAKAHRWFPTSITSSSAIAGSAASCKISAASET